MPFTPITGTRDNSDFHVAVIEGGLRGEGYILASYEHSPDARNAVETYVYEKVDNGRVMDRREIRVYASEHPPPGFTGSAIKRPKVSVRLPPIHKASR